MLNVTAPLAISPDEVWVLVSAPTGAVDAARMAHNPDTGRFVALPCQAFTTTGLVPLTFDGEPLPGFRWATTADIDSHADQFTNH